MKNTRLQNNAERGTRNAEAGTKNINSSFFRAPRSEFRVLFLGILFLGFLFAVVPAHALRVVPSYQVVHLAPGTSRTIDVQISNDAGKEVRVTPSAKNWVTLPENKEYEVGDWLIPASTQPFILKANEGRTMTFTAKAPEGAIGELVGMASFLVEEEQASMVNMRMSVAVYVAVQGTEEYEGDVRGLAVKVGENTVRGAAFVSNTGNVHMRLAGLIRLFDRKKNPIANIVVRPGHPIYPGESKPISGVVDDLVLKPGRYYIEGSFRDVDRGQTFNVKRRRFRLKKDGEVKLDLK